jgi:hypothetical protein
MPCTMETVVNFDMYRSPGIVFSEIKVGWKNRGEIQNLGGGTRTKWSLGKPKR